MSKTIILFLAFISSFYGEIRLLTFQYNRPELIEIQYKTFKKFLKNDFELIVFNDGDTPERERGIREMCEKYGIRCIRFEQEWHETDPLNQQVKDWITDPANQNPNNPGLIPPTTTLHQIAHHPSIMHNHVIQYALTNFAYTHDDIVAIVDGDLIAIREMDLHSMMADFPILGIAKYWWLDDIDYFWVPFIAFDPKRLPDHGDLRFHVDVIHHKLFDSGAHIWHYLKRHPEVAYKKYFITNDKDDALLSLSKLLERGYTENESVLIQSLAWPYTVEFHLDNHLLHFGASSFSKDAFQVKLKEVSKFVEKILN